MNQEENKLPESGPSQEALDAVSKVVDGVRDEQERAEIRQIEKDEKQQKKVIYRRAYLWLGVVAVLAVNLLFFLQSPQMSSTEVSPSQELEAFALIVNDSLRDFAMTNGGVYPETLAELTEKYLLGDASVLNALQQLDYRRPSTDTFVLSLTELDEDATKPALIITEKGVQP